VADAPQGLTLKRNRDLVGRRLEHPIRRVLLGLLFVFALLGLLNRFGQRPELSSTPTARAQLDLFAPDTVRGGLLFEARITVHALQELRDARLVLANGWTEGMTINTIEPSPLGEASHDGHLSLDLGHVPKGDEHVLWLQLQVNPTNVTHRSADVELFDGDSHVLTQRHTITVFP
jgi:hypothetical protein